MVNRRSTGALIPIGGTRSYSSCRVNRRLMTACVVFHEQQSGATKIAPESPRGLVLEGFGIVKAIKESGLKTTLVEKSCASACTLLFAMGETRAVPPKALVGFHRSYSIFGDFGTGWGPTEYRMADAPTARPGTAAYDQWVGTQLNSLQRLRDENAVRSLIYHYGRGNDEIAIRYADRATARQRGAAEYAKSFAPDVRVEVFALGGDKPIGQISGIAAWVEFVDSYYANNGYSSTLHLMSNFEVNFSAPDRASVSAYALAPHFFVRTAAKDKATQDTAVEWMIARYVYEARRQSDGQWRIERLQVNLEEISRAQGFFPGGQRNGR